MKTHYRSMCALLVALPLFSSNVQAQCLVHLDASDTTIACGDSVLLSASGAGIVFFEDWNSGTPSGLWANVTAAQIGNSICTPHPDGTNYGWVGDITAAPRSLQTIPMDITCGGNICFDLRYAIQGSAAPCEGPDLSNEGVHVEYSLNGGGTWSNIGYYPPNTQGNYNSQSPNSGDYTAWANYCLPIPVAALTTSTSIRFYQDGSSGIGFDHWGIDNISIGGGCTVGYYNWGNGWTTSSDTVVSATSTTTYTVQLAEQGDTCSTSINVNVNQPSITATAFPTTVCLGDSTQLDVIATGTSTSAMTTDFTWSPATGVSNANMQNPMASPTTNTTYLVTYVSPNAAACTSSDTVSVANVPTFSTTVTNTNPFACLRDTFSLIADVTPVGSYTYLWTSLAGAYNFSDPNVYNPAIITTSFGNYSALLTIVSPMGCVQIDTVYFDVTQAFLPGIMTSNDTTINQGTNAYLAVSSTTGSTTLEYEWSPNATMDDATSANPIVAPMSTTQYTVRAKDPATQCTNTDDVTVTVVGTVGVNDPALDAAIKVYPNPANEAFVVESSDNNITYTLYTATGQLIATSKTESATQRHSIAVTHLADGMYLLRIESNGKAIVRQITVVH